MLIKILLIVAIVIQTIATLFAIRLIRTTKYNSIWILFTIGFTLLSVERVVQFLRANGQTLPYEVFVWLGLVLSLIHISEPTRPAYRSRMPSSA